jgi:hypothetical protein
MDCKSDRCRFQFASLARKSLIAAGVRQLVIPIESRVIMGGNLEHAALSSFPA